MTPLLFMYAYVIGFLLTGMVMLWACRVRPNRYSDETNQVAAILVAFLWPAALAGFVVLLLVAFACFVLDELEALLVKP